MLDGPAQLFICQILTRFLLLLELELSFEHLSVTLVVDEATLL